MHSMFRSVHVDFYREAKNSIRGGTLSLPDLGFYCKVNVLFLGHERPIFLNYFLLLSVLLLVLMIFHV